MRRSILVVPLLALAGCGGSAHHRRDDRHRPANRSVAARSAPSAAAQDVREQAASDDRFAGRLYATLSPGDQTFAFSPFSISQALAMTAAGARGETLAQIEQALGFRLNVHNVINSLDSQLKTRVRAGVQLDVANSLWGQDGVRFEPPFLDILARDYGAPLQRVDYNDPGGAAQRINAWVAARTRDKIPTLVDPGSLANARLVLVNAVYLKARWATPFDPGDTEQAPFHAPGGDVTANFMYRAGRIDYVRGDGFQAVELPYTGGKLAMDLILPDLSLGAVERRLAAQGLTPLLRGLAAREVELGMPKLELSSRFELAAALAKLGARDLFGAGADLSGMANEPALHVSDVIHEVEMTVDEEGTEAAAATGVVGAGGAAEPSDAIEITFDSPFILAVRDRPTGEVLFLARVEHP